MQTRITVNEAEQLRAKVLADAMLIAGDDAAIAAVQDLATGNPHLEKLADLLVNLSCDAAPLIGRPA